MTCKHGITIESYEGIEYDCALGIDLCCSDCPFGVFPKDALLISIENGDIYYLDHSGNWANNELIKYINEGFDDWIMPAIEDDEDVKEAIETSKDTSNMYVVILNNASAVFSEKGWHKGTDWYYDAGGLEYIDFQDLIVCKVY